MARISSSKSKKSYTFNTKKRKKSTQVNPKKRRNKKKRKGGFLLPIILLLVAGVLVYLMVNVFELPASYPKSVAVKEIVVSENKVSVLANTETYNNKLIPLSFMTSVGGGQVSTLNEKEKQVKFSNGKQMTLTEGSKKVNVDGNTKKYNAPVMTVNDEIWVPGVLLEVVFGGQTSYKDGVASFYITDAGKEEGTDGFQTFTGTEGYLPLLNSEFPVDKDFQPSDLVDLNTLNGIEAYGGNTKLRKKAAEALNTMYDASNQSMILSSGFRTYKVQEELFTDQVAELKSEGLSAEEAKKKAATSVAVPGTSEHQVGLAADISVPGEPLDESFKNTSAGKWLAKNSYKYGFILRYPENKQSVTNVIFEPWHFRYVGLPHSEIMTKKGLTFEEYLNNLSEQKSMTYDSENGGRYGIWYLSESIKPEKVLFSGKNGADASTDHRGGAIVTIPLVQGTKAVKPEAVKN